MHIVISNMKVITTTSVCGCWISIAFVLKKVMVSLTFCLFAVPKCSTNPCYALINIFTSLARGLSSTASCLGGCSGTLLGSGDSNDRVLNDNQCARPLLHRKWSRLSSRMNHSFSSCSWRQSSVSCPWLRYKSSIC